MALNDLIRRLRLWSGASRNSAGIAESSRRSRRRTSLLRSTIAEFESRTLLAANYLYSLEARPGVPDDGFGFSLAANDQFHVVSNFAPYVSPLYLENYPDYFQGRFYGEIQVHDATTGDLLRTIQNPLPYGHPYFNNLHGFDNAYVTPNAFGYSIDISENLILVGSPGWDSRFVPEPDNNDSETGGRAFLFDANTGDLLHTFDGSFVPTGTQGRNNDGFGRSVAIDGDRIIIGAPGPSYFDEEEQIWDTDSGHVYIYSATTGNLLHMMESPDPSPEETLDYGAMVSVSDGKLVVTQGTDFGYETFGPTLVYDVQSGDLLHTLSDGGGLSHPAVIVGNVIAVGHSPGITDFYNAATGTLTQTINDRLLAFDGNLIVTQSGSTTGLGDIADLAIRDFPSGNVLYNVPAPPNFVEAIWGYNQIPQLSVDRLLIPGRQGTATHDVVFVYSVTDGVTNSPPIDMALSNNSIAENSLSNTTIGTLSAADPDAPEIFSFSLLNDANARFEIVGNQLRVQTGTLLNFEVATSHSITVRVTDSAGNTFDKAFTIQVTNVNETPTDIALSNNFVPETAPANAVIGTFSTVDPDSPETHIYDLLDNAGGRFQVSGSMLRVADNSLLDYETSTSHQISVRVTDSAGNQRTEQFVIQVVNVNEATPTDIGLSGSVVSESVVRTVHSTTATGTLFGADIAADGDRMLVAEAFGTFPNIEYKVHVIDAETGAPLRTLTVPSLDPLASDPDGRFGQTLVVSGSRAYVGAYSTRVGNLDEAGVVYVFDIPTGNLLLTLNSPTPTTMGFFGSSLAISGNVLAVSAINEATGTVYLFHATTGQLLETVVNPTPTPLAAFGQSFAMNGDTLVIGSRFEDIGANNAGRAYIYEFDSATSTATLVHTLNNPSPADDERFGDTVAVSGNLVAVKDSTSFGSDTNVGSVHLFDRVTGAYLRTLTNPTPGTTDQFGSSLAISGDFVIANSNSDIGGLNNGRAYVFQASTGALLATIKNPSPNANDEFASKLALAGNWIVASAVRDDTDGNNRGLVYVFDLAIGQAVGTLSATDTDLGETFTYSLLDDADGRFAIDGDQLVIADSTKLDYETATSHNVTVQVLDSVGHAFSKSLVISVSPRSEAPSDIALPVQPVAEGAVRTLHNPTAAGIPSFGYQTASDGFLTVVGHNNLPVNGLSGQVSVFNNVTGELVSLLSSPTGDTGELFGERVAISGNIVIVSARLNDTSGVDAGVVYVFNATSGDLLHTLVNPSPSNTGGGTDQFGFEVAISGNLIAIGSQDDLGTTDSGAVHLYNATSGTLLQTLANPTPLNQSRFGQSLSLEGQTLVVGASSTNQAYVYTFNPASQTAALTATLSNVGGGTLELFGMGIGQVGDFVAVGASFNDSTGTNSGRVLIYNRNTGSFLRVIDNPTPAIEDNFGQFISVSSTTGLLAISAQGDDTGAADAGSVYLFDPATGNLVTIIHNPSPNAGDFFTRISWGGARLIVGAPTDDTDGGNLGQVYVYEPLLQNVGTLSATDPDTGDSLTFALVDDANGRFSLQGTTIIADQSKIDFETATSHQIIVQVTDASGLSIQEAYLIPITNIQESPLDIQFTPSSVNENAPNGTIVSTLSTLDPEGDSVTYTMLDSAGGRFTIQGNQIVVANGSLLDYETTTSHRVRVRVTDATGQTNVESRLISVNDQANEIDFGDLPNTFGTTLASNGARHAFGGDLRFGNTITGEANGQPSANANLDSGDDGVFLPQVLIPGHEALIRFAMPIVGQIDGFIDFDNSGSFQASERVTSSGQTLPLVNGLYELTISVPITAVAGNVGARFRISSAGGLGPLGLAPNGEIEDYRISIAAKTSGTVQVLPDPMQTGGSFMFVNGGSGNDKIIVAPANGGLRATINGVNKLPIAPMTVFKIIIHGHAGKDDIQINGTTVSGQIDGGTQDDTIRGGLGHDVIYGRAGNDKLYGGDGMDTQYGGDGNDLMNSEGGVGYMFGENGKDIMTGNGVLVGGAGNDTLYGSGSRNLLIGGTGKDKLNGANSNQGDLIVSGSTAYDNNPTQLAVFRFIWDSPVPVLDRITSISNGIPTSSGLIALNNTTVFPDPQVDQIFNFGSNIPILNDWIFKSNNDIKSSPLGIVTVI